MKKQKKSHSSKKKEATVNGKKIWLRLAPGLVAVAVAMALGGAMQQALRLPDPSDVEWNSPLTLPSQSYEDLLNSDLFTLPPLTRGEALPTLPFFQTQEPDPEPPKETAPSAQTQPLTREDSAVAVTEPVDTREPEELSPTAPAEEPAIAPAGVFVPPVEGEVVTVFQPDRLCWNDTLKDWRAHHGIDLACETGTPVRAVSDGTVVLVTDAADTGVTVCVDHGDGLVSTVGGLGLPLTVSVGQRVEAGTVMGYSVGTPPFESHDVPHIHVELTQNGEQIDPQAWWTKPQM
ncbi:MAG: peptidoglycan DD-metalloendopeptidase family protein [Clostridia bacterium]|nr:peptidoglycan DD-metalloendopeptidase family protein [Clostridia bacterium]